MPGFTAVKGRSSFETVVNKSRFLSVCAYIENEADAERILAELRAEYRDATHCCFGYISDDSGAIQRFSDAGEPSGTAGMPILDVLKARKLRHTLVAVVRWFGGVKLGAGGLVRAYSGAASEGLNRADICSYVHGTVLSVSSDYKNLGSLTYLIGLHDGTVISTGFGEEIEITFSVETSVLPAVTAAAENILGRKNALTVIEEKFIPAAPRTT